MIAKELQVVKRWLKLHCAGVYEALNIFAPCIHVCVVSVSVDSIRAYETLT